MTSVLSSALLMKTTSMRTKELEIELNKVKDKQEKEFPIL